MNLKLAGYINLAMAMVMAGVFAIERQRENGWSVALVAVLGVVFAYRSSNIHASRKKPRRRIAGRSGRTSSGHSRRGLTTT